MTDLGSKHEGQTQGRLSTSKDNKIEEKRRRIVHKFNNNAEKSSLQSWSITHFLLSLLRKNYRQKESNNE